MAKKVLPAVVFGLAVAAAGVAHGLHTGRWQPSSGLDEAVRKLDGIPPTFGAWKGRDMAIDAESQSRAGIKGYVYRQYRNEHTGEEVTVLLVCGRPGPISVHTPDVCYEGAGYQPAGDQTRTEIRRDDGESSPFWSQRYRTPGTAARVGRLEILWSWTAGGGWAAPDAPRWTFARYPALYKLYAVREVPPAVHDGEDKPAKEFLAAFLPEVDRALSGPPKP